MAQERLRKWNNDSPRVPQHRSSIQYAVLLLCRRRCRNPSPTTPLTSSIRLTKPLISHDLCRTRRWLIHRRRRFSVIVRRRWLWVCVHAVALTLWILRVPISRLWRVVILPLRHPAMIPEERQSLAHSTLGVNVAADEEDEDGAEEEGYEGVADCHARLRESC